MYNLYLKSLEGAGPCPSLWTMTAYCPSVCGGLGFRGGFASLRLATPSTPMRSFDTKLCS